MITEWDIEDAKKIWREEALKKGHKESHAESHAKLLASARNLKALGVPMDIIAKSLDLPLDEVVGL